MPRVRTEFGYIGTKHFFFLIVYYQACAKMRLFAVCRLFIIFLFAYYSFPIAFYQA